MQSSLPEREAKFYIEDDCLVRKVTAADGRGYSHRCSKEIFETVACAIEETPAEGEGTTLTAIVNKVPVARDETPRQPHGGGQRATSAGHEPRPAQAQGLWGR